MYLFLSYVLILTPGPTSINCSFFLEDGNCLVGFRRLAFTLIEKLFFW